jgi:uncharacterized protein
MHNAHRDDQHSGAARNPMVWLVVGLPALVVVAAFATLAIAIGAGGSDALPDNVNRMAQIQTTDLDADEYAAAQRLSAVLSIGEGMIEILPASGELLKDEAVRKQPLTLRLQHPTRSAEDRELLLQPTDHGWRIAERLDLAHDWRVQLIAACTAVCRKRRARRCCSLHFPKLRRMIAFRRRRHCGHERFCGHARGKAVDGCE